MTSRRNNRRSFDQEALEEFKAEQEMTRARRLSAGREEKEEDLFRASSTSSSSVASDLSSISDFSLESLDSNNNLPATAVSHASNGEPDNFAIVVPGIYRSSYPQSEHYQYLKTLGLKTIITLVSKEFPEGFETFMQENGIRHVLINVEATKKANIPDATLHAILNIALDKASQPILIHCNHGKHRTGVVVSAIRHWQSWPCERIIDEYKQFAEPKARPGDLQYIADFNVASLSAINVASRGTPAAKFEITHGLGGSPGDGRINQKSLRIFIMTVVILVIWTLTLTCWKSK